MIVNFGFVIDNELAGLAHPDSFGDVESALDELKNQGIGALVSLDENGVSPDLLAERGLAYIHIPVEDFTPPDMDQAAQFVDFTRQQRDNQKVVAVHCRGGYGRTGTLIACYLISQGKSAQDAIELVRRRRPGSIETAGQENFLKNFETITRTSDR